MFCFYASKSYGHEKLAVTKKKIFHATIGYLSLKKDLLTFYIKIPEIKNTNLTKRS